MNLGVLRKGQVLKANRQELKGGGVKTLTKKKKKTTCVWEDTSGKNRNSGRGVATKLNLLSFREH